MCLFLSCTLVLYVLVKGGWTCSKCYLNILLLIALFYLVFHVTLNSCNTKLKNDGVHWGSLDILEHALCKLQDYVHYFVKVLEFWV